MMTDNCPLTKKPMACASITFSKHRCGTWISIEKCQYCGDAFFNGLYLQLGRCIHPFGGFRCDKRHQLLDMEDFENRHGIKIVAEFKTDKQFKPGMFVAACDVTNGTQLKGVIQFKNPIDVKNLFGDWIKTNEEKESRKCIIEPDGDLIMHKKVIEIRVDENGSFILDEEQLKHSKCPVCGKHGVRVVSVATERTASKFCYSGELHQITIEFYCDNCATEKGTLTCDADYLKVEMVKMKTVSEYRFYARSIHNSPWQLILETNDKAEYELIRKYDFKLSRFFGQLNEDVKIEEKHEWVNA